MSDLGTLIEIFIKANESKRQKNYKTAIEFYLRAIERFGENADIYSAIASCYFSLALHDNHETGQNYYEAVAWIKRAISLVSDNAYLHATLADYCSLGTLDNAQAALEYRKAIEIDPNLVTTLVGAAALYDVPEKVITLDEATIWLERAIRLKPDDPNYHARLGQLYHEAGRITDAQQEWVISLLCSLPLDSGYVQIIKTAFTAADKRQD